MSKTPYTINVDEYICTELEQIRTMDKTRDYSALMATIERIQYHASRMEGALYTHQHNKNSYKKVVRDKKLSNKEKVVKLKGLLNEQ